MPSIICRCLALLTGLFLCVGSVTADEPTPLRIHIISGSNEYQSEPSLKALQKELQDKHHIHVTASWVKDGANDLPEIENIPKADLVMVFARRLKLPMEQMVIVRKHWESGKPVIGIRTASHAFGNEDNQVLDRQVFGGNYTGHHGNEPVQVTFVPEVKDHPILKGVGPFESRKLYKVGELAESSLVLQTGTIADKKITHPVTWVNEYKGARMFYTSLGVPSDFENPNFQRMLVNAIHWTTRRGPEPGALRESLEQQLLREGASSLARAARESGDAQRGAILFHQRHTACSSCHATGKGKSPLGPDLTQFEKKPDPVHIVESILEPSKVIEQEYRAVSIETLDGRLIVGLITDEKPNAIVVREPANPDKGISILKDEIDTINQPEVSLMPAGVVNQLTDRGQFLDLARYVIEIAEHGPVMARKLDPSADDLKLPAEALIDHAARLRELDSSDLKLGRELYHQYCLSCHGADGNKTLNPLSRRFAKDPLKFGTDPYSMWKTITYGNGLMFPQAAVLSAEERYHVVHYIRESFIKELNPSQYFRITNDYLSGVNSIARADAEKFGPATPTVEVAAGMIDGKQGQRMDYGPYLCHSVAYTPPQNTNAARFEDTTERALIIRLPGDRVVCYDMERYSVSGLWSGSLATTAKTHHTSYKGNSCLSPGGPVVYKNVHDAGWAIRDVLTPADEAGLQFRGHYLHGGQVLLAFTVGGRAVAELPSATGTDPVTLSRSFQVDAGESPLFCLVGRFEDGKVSIERQNAKLTHTDATMLATLTGDRAGLTFTSDNRGGLWLQIPPSKQARSFTLWYGLDGSLSVPENPASPELNDLTTGGPRHWPRDVATQVLLGQPVEGYVADEFTVPFANPWGSWMRTTAIDFFSDGRAAVSTLSGDVWIVSTSSDDPTALTWSRFATGLYEPLGLKIVDDRVYVRGRDRITRLHDRNGNGEADYYECFHQEDEIGASYHSFIFDLQTDQEGNFYFARSGRKSPHEGAVIRVSPDGTSSEIVCRDFRHPNGMGVGGPHGWITVSDNPDGKAVYNGVSLVKEGQTHGYEQPRNAPMLAVLPATVDSSSGGQCWTDPNWGPLGNMMIHTSYSHSRAFYVLTENVEPHPNGFAIELPFAFKSGVMRARVNPADGQLYLVGQKGWDSRAPYDGCVYRIRHVGGPSHLINSATVTREGIRFGFTCELEPSSVGKTSVTVVRDSGKATTPVPLGSVRVVDGRTIEVGLPEIADEDVSARSRTDTKTGATIVDVRMPLRLTIAVKTADGTMIEQTVFATVNTVPSE